MKLFEHQKQAIKSLHNGCILCAGVGTGKSMTALAYYMLRVCDGKYTVGDEYTPPSHISRQLIIITTAKKRDSLEWDTELERWGLSREHGKNEFGMYPIIDSWNNIKKYVNYVGCFFIFDEQRVTGYGAWVKSFFKIANRNRWILLSATPGDTWMDYMPVFVANGYYRNKTDFMMQHVVLDPHVKYMKIRYYVRTDILERHRSEVLVIMKYDKPTLSHHEDIFVSYDKELFAKAWKDRWNPYTNKPIKQVAELYAVAKKIMFTDKSRIEKLKDLCLRHIRVIIFYNYNYELELIRAALDEINKPYTEWNGHKHEAILDAPSWAYLVQYNAGAEGWECTETNIMLFYSQTYSYRATQQASGRIDRLNTPFTDLWFYHMKCTAPVDLGISKSLNRKEDFNEQAFLEEEAEEQMRKEILEFNEKV